MFRRRNADDFSDEVRAHLEHEEAELRAAGMSAGEARAEAQRRFGNPARAIEEVRDTHPLRWLATLWQDVRFGVRLMRRSPAFSLTAIFVLSLGIGVNTALFSIVNALFFEPPPLRAPEELFYVYTKNEAGQVMAHMSPQEFEFFEQRAPDLAEYTGHFGTRMTLTIDNETEQHFGEWVQTNYFDFLGVDVVLGRPLGPQEDDLSNPDLALVISHDLWKRRFGGDAAVLGKRVRLREWESVIVGVAEPGFTGLTDPWNPSQFWVAGQQMQSANQGRPIAVRWIGGPIGRLGPGVSFAQVQAFFAATLPAWRQDRIDAARTYPNRTAQDFEITRRRMMAHQMPIYRAVDVRMPFDPESHLIPPAMLAGIVAVVALVLLIAAANIAGLLLARGVARTGEVAVRRALGAAGMRVTRQLLTESTLLAIAGGVLGLTVAIVLVGLFRAYTPSRFAVDVGVDVRVLLFAIAVCVGAGVLVGLAPALQAARVNVLEALGSGIVGARVVRSRLRYWIVMPQIAVSLTLLLIAAVHVRALLSIERADTGYRTDAAVALTFGRWAPLTPMGARDWQAKQAKEAETIRQFNRSVIERVSRVPQVSSFAIGTLPLRSGYAEFQSLITQDAYNAGEAPFASAVRTVVSDRYFEVMGMRLLAGRTFDARDGWYEAFAPRVAVLPESVARTLWPAGNAIGQTFGIVPTDARQKIEWLQVVGIVNDVEPILDDARERPLVYVPLGQQWRPSERTLIVRGAGDRGELIRDVKAAVIGADAFAEVTSVQTIEQIRGEILYPRRIAASILLTAGLIGLLLASIGLYGVMSYSIAQRRREIGIRATLGADRRNILALVLREGAVIAGSATAVGFVVALLALRATSNLVPDLPAVDVASFIAVPVVLAAIVGAACVVPARRAARVDPATALR